MVPVVRDLRFGDEVGRRGFGDMVWGWGLGGKVGR